MDDIHYREYKILLRPERFFDPHQFEVYWHKLCLIAPEFKVGVTTNKDGFKRQVREVLFYDTPDYDLYRNAFILRKRTFYTDGWPEPQHELTFKFRHADLETAAGIDVTPHLHGTANIKFKEELLPLKNRLGGVRSLYSHNVEFPYRPRGLADPTASETLVGIFPALSPILCEAGEHVEFVNHTAVEEVLQQLGTLEFGKTMAAPCNVSVWRTRGEQTQLVGEFAYQVRFNSRDELGAKALQRSESFFRALQDEARDWVLLGATKTGAVYRLQGASVESHE